MRRFTVILIVVSLIGAALAAFYNFSSEPNAQAAKTANATDAPVLTLAKAAEIMAEFHCKETELVVPTDTIKIRTSALPLVPDGVQIPDNALTGLEFVSGFALTSDDPRFGGLSGLDWSPMANGIVVSDQGYVLALPSLSVSDDGREITSFLLELKDQAGNVFADKRTRDAEGLTIYEDYAFISFEWDHRILGYNFGRCGGDAAGIMLTELPNILPQAQGGAMIPDNSGAEALTIIGNSLVFGPETMVEGKAGLFTMQIGGEYALALGPIDTNTPIVGADTAADGTVYTLHRNYNPDIGNTIEIFEHNDDISERLAHLTPPLNIDNFEGIAVKDDPRLGRLVFIVSDNNYSDDQRTLLMTFARAN